MCQPGGYAIMLLPGTVCHLRAAVGHEICLGFVVATYECFAGAPSATAMTCMAWNGEGDVDRDSPLADLYLQLRV